MKNIRFDFSRRRVISAWLVLLLLLPTMLPWLLPKASAGVLTYGLVRFDRMNASQATTGLICAKTNGAAQTEAAVAVTFPTGYTVSTTTGNWTATGTSNAGWPKDPADGTTAATSWPSIAGPSAANQISSQTVQFTGGNLAANTWYCFNWTNSAAISIKSSASSDNTGIITTCSNTTDCASTGSGGGTTGNLDTSSWATASVANNCGSGSQACDQIQVSANVTATFSFSLSSTTAALGTLSTGSPTASSAVNASVSTNAQRGWNMWAADLAGTPGLTSSTASKTITYSPSAGSTASALSTGNEGYNLGAGSNSGTCNGSTTIDPNFASGGTSYKGGGLDNTMRGLALSTGTAASCIVPLTVNASIAGTTPAATDYAGTITVIAAGRF